MKQYRFKSSKDHKWVSGDGRHALSFLINLEEIQKEFQATENKKQLPILTGFTRAIKIMTDASRKQRKLIFIGNGGSAAIASHQAVDYWKNGGINATSFNDSSLLTCVGNDCGYENVFSVPIKCFAKPGDVLIAISSSGKSPNIINAVKAAREMGCKIITFSGFSPTNALRDLGTVNFYVPSNAYGIVEVSHLALIHSILREIIFINPAAKKKGY